MEAAAGEMAQGLRAQVIHPEDLDLVPSTQVLVYNHLHGTSVPED